MSELGLGGSTPQINRSGETPGSKRLFYSVRDIALIKDKYINPGYGYLKAGQLMAADSVTGNLVPYEPTTAPAHLTQHKANAFLVADAIDTESTCKVGLEDSYKFVVGQSLILVNDNSGTAVVVDCGAIVSIDRTTYPHLAVITFTTALAVATFTVARFSMAYVKTGTSTPFSTAKYILDKDVNTGSGSTALGGQTSVVLSNAILYTASLTDLDTAAKTALGTVDDGAHTILK